MHLYHLALVLEFVRLFDGHFWCHPSAVPVRIINTLSTPPPATSTPATAASHSAPSALGNRDGCIRRSPYSPPFSFLFSPPILWGLTSVFKHLWKADTRLVLSQCTSFWITVLTVHGVVNRQSPCTDYKACERLELCSIIYIWKNFIFVCSLD